MRLLLAGLMAAVAVTACGGSSASPSSSSAAATATPAETPTPTPTPAAAINTASCPAPSVVNSALGTDFTTSTTVSSGTLLALPSGTGHIACAYTSGSAGVLLILLNNMPASLFTTEEQDLMAVLSDRGFNVNGVTSTPVPGLGDEAVSFTSPSVKYGSAVGVDVQQGTNRVVVFEGEATPSLNAVESLATQLLS